jgi:hypothetical protein
MENNPNWTPDLLLYRENISRNIVDVQLTGDLCSDQLAIIVKMDLQAPPLSQEEQVIVNIKKI